MARPAPSMTCHRNFFPSSSPKVIIMPAIAVMMSRTICIALIAPKASSLSLVSNVPSSPVPALTICSEPSPAAKPICILVKITRKRMSPSQRRSRYAAHLLIKVLSFRISVPLAFVFLISLTYSICFTPLNNSLYYCYEYFPLLFEVVILTTSNIRL